MSDIQAEPQVIETPTPTPGDQAPTEPQQPKLDWVPKRISEVTAARRAAEARAEAAEAREREKDAEIARLRSGAAPGEGQQQQQQTPPDIDKLARSYAERMVSEQRAQDTMKSRIDAINEAGMKEFGEDFDKSVQNLNMAGIGGPEFLKVLTNIKGADKLVTWLGKNENINEAMRIASLDPVQMAIEMSDMVPKAAKALSKPVSKVPPPPTPVDGSGSADGSAPDPKDTKAWIEYRNKTARKRR